MNRISVVDIGTRGAMLCRFSVFVRVGPGCRDATNKHLGDEENPCPFFASWVFLYKGNPQRSNNCFFFDVRYGFLSTKNSDGVLKKKLDEPNGFSLPER